MRQTTPRGLAGAHELLVAVDLDLEALSADVGGISPQEARERIAEIQAIVARALEFTSAETGRPI